jgi:hypothetical protein
VDADRPVALSDRLLDLEELKGKSESDERRGGRISAIKVRAKEMRVRLIGKRCGSTTAFAA